MIALDLETHKIQPGLLAPPIVCGSFADGFETFVFKQPTTLQWARDFLEQREVIAGANIAYDFGCLAAADPSLLPLIFAKYDRDEVHDVSIAQTLHAIAEGLLRDEHGNKCILDPRTGRPHLDSKGRVAKRYSLEIVTDLYFPDRTAKENARFRTSYALLEDLPISQWPADAIQYPKDDAKNTYDVAQAQLLKCRNLCDLPAQCRAAWALHLGSLWGLRADRQRTKQLGAWLDWLHEGATEYFVKWGILSADGKESGAKVTELVARAYGASGTCPQCGGSGRFGGANPKKPKTCDQCWGSRLDLKTAPNLPRTDTGRVSTSRDTLAESGDEVLEAYGAYGPNDKNRQTYLPFLEEACVTPTNLKPNVLVSSGRTSYDGVIQLLPRKGGVRECIVPLPGRVLCSCDYAAIEGATLAQVCLWTVGWSKLAEAINADRDIHCDLAADVFLLDYDFLLKNKNKQPHKDQRWACKAGNFGFGGMMGGLTFTIAKRKEGLRVCTAMGRASVCGIEKVTEWRGRECPPTCRTCIEASEDLRRGWMTKWNEMPEYFNWITKTLNQSAGELTQFISKRVRGGLNGPRGANTLFQGLAADGAKRALWKITRECYLDKTSPLYGSRLLTFAHDETLMEHREDVAHEAAMRQAQLMEEGMREVVPDVKIAKIEPALMRRWYKDAESRFDSNGRLIPWEP